MKAKWLCFIMLVFCPAASLQTLVTVTNIAAGDGHGLFIKSDGSLWGMGDNQYGQLGLGAVSHTNSPAQIVAGAPQVLAVASFSLSGTNLVIRGANGQTGKTCYTLMTTNLATALSQWAPIATNSLSVNGDFSITVTNVINRPCRDSFIF
jgi:alpha-tubulin suppressor-like RCC1 family protein